MTHFRTRYFLLLASMLLYAGLVTVLIWYYQDQLLDFLQQWPMLKVFILALALSATGILWLKIRHRIELRSWLMLKVVGNLVFIAAVGLTWLLDLGAETMFLIILFAFVFWGWGLATLVREAKHRNDDTTNQGTIP